MQIAWQIAYTIAGVSLLIGLSAVIVVGSIVCVTFARDVLDLTEDR